MRYFYFLFLLVFVGGCAEDSGNGKTSDNGELTMTMDGTEYSFNDYTASLVSSTVIETKETHSNAFEINVKNADYTFRIATLELNKGNSLGNTLSQKSYPTDINDLNTSPWCVPEYDQNGEMTLLPCGGGRVHVGHPESSESYQGFRDPNGYVRITRFDAETNTVSGVFKAMIISTIFGDSRADTMRIQGQFNDIQYRYID